MVGLWIDRGDLWKRKARFLQLRLKDRFRVAVDRHNRHRKFSRSYFSSTVDKWSNRFRNFRRESLPSSVFYRKRVNNGEEDSVIVRALQALAVPILGNVCHVFMHGLNRVQVYGVEKLHEALLHRRNEKPLITVSNHVASIDDPLVIASLIPPGALWHAYNLRWTLCATDRCFSNPFISAFFRCVKVLPVSRGDGIYQKGLDLAIAKLNKGGWVHIFPEGTRSRDGGRSIGSAKRGIGRLVLDADSVPLVVPFVHTGMQDIMPVGSKIPRIGKTVTVLVGDPIEFDDLLDLENPELMSSGKIYDVIASRVGRRLQEMKLRVDRLASGQVDTVTSHMISGESYSSMCTADSRLHPDTFLVRSSISRIRGSMDPTELVGFAARGLFFIQKGETLPVSRFRIVDGLKVWRQFLEANLFHQWHVSNFSGCYACA